VPSAEQRRRDREKERCGRFTTDSFFLFFL